MQRKIPMTDNFKPLDLLTTDSLKAKWGNEGLQTDTLSIENGAVLHSAARWPLLIDPQLQVCLSVPVEQLEPACLASLGADSCAGLACKLCPLPWAASIAGAVWTVCKRRATAGLEVDHAEGDAQWPRHHSAVPAAVHRPRAPPACLPAVLLAVPRTNRADSNGL